MKLTHFFLDGFQSRKYLTRRLWNEERNGMGLDSFDYASVTARTVSEARMNDLEYIPRKLEAIGIICP